MQVREGMSEVTLTVGPGHTLREAAKLMARRGVGAAIVIDRSATLAMAGNVDITSDVLTQLNSQLPSVSVTPLPQQQQQAPQGR